MKRVALIGIFIVLWVVAFTQTKTDGYTLPANVDNGDTVAIYILDEVTISPSDAAAPLINTANYSKLVRDVKESISLCRACKRKA